MKKLTFLACAAALSVAGVGPAAQAHTYHHYRHYRHYRTCGAERRARANRGTVIGAVGGGLLGNAVSGHGGKLGGTLIGAGAGAVVGHQIGKHSYRC